MSKNQIRGNVFVPFDWGEYLLWKRYPESRVSIDGRFRTIYPESVIRNHFFPRDDLKGWARLLGTYPGDVILAERDPQLKAFLAERGDWVYVYSDPIAMIFIRKNAKNNAVLDKFYRPGLVYDGLDDSIYFP